MSDDDDLVVHLDPDDEVEAAAAEAEKQATELENVWSGKKTAKSALDSAVKRGNVLLRRFESSNR